MTNPTQRTLLIIEDSDDDFIATLRACTKAGVTNPIERCVDGDEALDYLFRRNGFAEPKRSPRPEIILLDLNLPATDGREVLRVLKADANLRNIPVIVLTTSGADRDVNDSYAAGANSYLQKPASLSRFVETLSMLRTYWLELVRLPH